MKDIRKLGGAMTTNELTENTLEFLTLNGCFVWRSNNTPVVKHHRLSRIKGVPDIIGMTRTGKFIGIEIKNESTKDKLSESQIAFRQNVFEKHGVYFTVRKIDDLKDINFYTES